MTANYKPNIMIVGPSGSGKSSSIVDLSPAETIIIDTELKGFPFKNKPFDVKSVTSPDEFYKALTEALAAPEKKYIVIDTLTKHIENAMNFCRTCYKGFDIWSNYNMNIRRSVNMCKSKDKTIIVMCQDELTEIMSAEGTKSSKRCAATLAGKEWDGKLEKEFLIVFFTDVRKNPKFSGVEDVANRPMLYQFLTNSDGICTAKSPAGMFDRLLVSNNLRDQLVKVEEYYK